MIRQLAILAIALFTLLAGSRLAIAAPPEGVGVTYEVGYDGIVQKGRLNPVTVEIDNQNPGGLNLSGELVLKYEGTEYTTRLELPSPSKKRFYLYFPCSQAYPQLSLMVRTDQWTDEMDLGQIKTCEASDTSIVVLTDQPGSLQAANQVESARITRDEWVSESAGMESSKSYVSYFDIDEVDDNAKFFERADSIVLADIDYLQLDEPTGRALMESVSRGANLIFSLGSNGNRVASSPVGQLCPMGYSGTVETGELGELGRRYGINPGNALATLSTGPLRDGAEVVSYAGSYPAIVRRSWGAGNVYALAFSFTDRPFRQHPGLGEMFSDLTMNVRNSVDVNNWFLHPQAIFNLMRNLDEAKPMDPGFVALFIVLYVLLIGPLNFFVLGRMKRSTLVWLTIPIIIIGFSWFGLETGRITRGADNVVANFQEVHVYPDSTLMPYQDAMYVFTAEPVRYELEVQDPSAFLYTDYPVVSGNQFGTQMANRGGINPFITRSLDNTVNPKLNISQGKWAAKEYYYRGFRNLQAVASGDLKDTDSSRDGSFTPEGSFDLDLPWALHGCRLLGRQNYSRDIGDLDAKGSFQLDQLGSGRGSWFEDDNYVARYREDLLDGVRNSMSEGLRYSNDLLLVGFTEDLERLAEFDRAHVQHTLSMVVIHLPCEKQHTRSGGLRLASNGPLLTGGRNFRLFQNNYYSGFGGYRPEYDTRRYVVLAGGYLEFQLDMQGSPSERDFMAATLRLFSDDRDAMMASDAAGIATLEGLSTNGDWVAIPIQSGTRDAMLPVAELLQPDNSITLRVRAKTDLQAENPEITIN
ncbi:MAG: hypothetical protein H7A35_00290 [Planctomycetales bacterium]|nr:hypothetical protein [bacterium]UNM08501.1 MAG: hypothetical protein H7A35_00290 [Planctomycetales bacterium]